MHFPLSCSAGRRRSSILVGLLAAIAAAVCIQAQAQSPYGIRSPYVTRASSTAANTAAAMALRAQLKKIAADRLKPGVSFSPADTSQNNQPATNSLVQTADYSLATYFGYEGISSTNPTAAQASAVPSAAMPTNVDPVWSPDENFIIFASNRASATDPTPTAVYQLYAISAGGGSTLTQLTAGHASCRFPAFVGTSINNIVYCQAESGANGFYDLYAASLSTSGGYSLSNAYHIPTPWGLTSLSVEHPSASGSTVVFAGLSETGTPEWHLYSVALVNPGPVTELTYPNAGNTSYELDPALSPDGAYIAFDTNATSYSLSGGQLTASNTVQNLNIGVMNLSGSLYSQLTTSANTVSIQPCWSSSQYNQFINAPANRQYIFFSRMTTASGVFHIYYLRANESASGGALLATEGGSGDAYGANTAVEVDTSDYDESLSADPFDASSTQNAAQLAQHNQFQPTVSKLQAYPMVAYSSDRYLSNNTTDNPVNGIVRDLSGIATHIDNFPDDYATSAVDASYGLTSGATTLLPADSAEVNNLELCVSRLFATDPPTLLRYDESTTEIFRIESFTAQGTAGKLFTPGSTINIVARLSDREAGINGVYLQLKDPSSKYQNVTGLEHKVFTKSMVSLDNGTGGSLPAHNSERTAISEDDEATKYGNLEPNFTGISLYPNIGGSGTPYMGGAGSWNGFPIEMASAYTTTYGVGGASTPIQNSSTSGSFTLSTIGSNTFAPGDTIYVVNTGGVHFPSFYDFVVSATYVAGSGTTPATQTITLLDKLPGTNVDYAAASDTSTSAAYTSVVRYASRSFDGMGNEIDCQALNIANGITAGGGSGSIAANVNVDGARPTDLTSFNSVSPYNYTTPEYAPVLDDVQYWSAQGAMPYWIPMYPLQTATSSQPAQVTQPAVGTEFQVTTVTGFAVGDKVWVYDTAANRYEYGQVNYVGTISAAGAKGPLIIGTVPSTPGGTSSPLSNAYASGATIYENQSVGGGVLYMTTLTTPQSPADYYLDLIAYDNSTYPISYNTNSNYSSGITNWVIYDNVSGFSTAPFQKNNSILIVNDHALPQKYFTGAFGNTNRTSNYPATVYGAESYFTDIDTSFNDTTYTNLIYHSPTGNGNDTFTDAGRNPIEMRPPANLPDFGIEVPATSAQSPDNTHEPWVAPLIDTTNFAASSTFPNTTYATILLNQENTGSISQTFGPAYGNGLGVNSYADNPNMTNDTGLLFSYGQNTPVVSRNLPTSSGNHNVEDEVVDLTNVSPEPPSQKYDIWRILSRGPVTQSVLDGYQPQVGLMPTATGTVNGTVTMPVDGQGTNNYFNGGTVTILANGVTKIAAETTQGTSTTAAVYSFSMSGVPIGQTTVYAEYGQDVATGSANTTVSFGTTTTVNITVVAGGAALPNETPATGNTNVLIAPSCVLWISPFPSDQFVEQGSIMDQATQSMLISFIQAGGRLFVDGSDVAYGLTSGGAFNDTLFNTYLTNNGGFASDTSPGSQANYTYSVPAANEPQLVATDAFLNYQHPGFVRLTTGNATYSAPSGFGNQVSNLYYQALQSTTINSDFYADGSLDSFSWQTDNGGLAYNNMVSVGQNAVPQIQGPSGNGSAVQFVMTGDPLMTYNVNLPPYTGATGPWMTAFSSFGLEALSQIVTPLNNGTRPSYLVVDNQRTNYLHNLVCAMRTASITGRVTTSTNGGQPLPGATVSATYALFDGDHVAVGPLGTSSANIYYTATTDANGNYTIQGLPAGAYNVTATTQVNSNTYLHSGSSNVVVHGGDYTTVNPQINETSVTVTIDVKDPTTGGINGATVELFPVSAETSFPTAPSGSPLYSTTSNSSGVASISNVGPGTYLLYITAGSAYQPYDSSWSNEQYTPPGSTLTATGGFYFTVTPTGYQVELSSGTDLSTTAFPYPIVITMTPVIVTWFNLTDIGSGLPLADSTNFSVVVDSSPQVTLNSAGTNNGNTTQGGILANTYQYTATAAGYEPNAGTVEISSSGYTLNPGSPNSSSGSTMPIPLKMVPIVTYVVTLEDHVSNALLPGAQVTMTDASTGQVYIGTDNNNGTYTFSIVPHDPYFIAVNLPWTNPATQTLYGSQTPLATTETASVPYTGGASTVYLNPSVQVTVQLTDQSNGSDLPDTTASVVVNYPGTTTGGVTLSNSGAGLYQGTVNIVNNPSDPNYTIVVGSVPGYLDANQTFTLPSAGSLPEQTVGMDPTEIDGQVVASAGSVSAGPLANAQVTLSANGAAFGSSTTTDSNGNYRFVSTSSAANRLTGSYTTTATATGYSTTNDSQPVTIATGATTNGTVTSGSNVNVAPTITLTPLAVPISVTVSDGSTPLTDSTTTVVVNYPSTDTTDQPVTLTYSSSANAFTGMINPVANSATNPYTVNAGSQGYLTDKETFTISGVNMPVSKQYTLVPLSTKITVTDTSSNPVPNVKVTLSGGSLTTSLTTGGSGQVTFTTSPTLRLPAGAYTATAVAASPYRDNSAQVTLVDIGSVGGTANSQAPGDPVLATIQLGTIPTVTVYGLVSCPDTYYDTSHGVNGAAVKLTGSDALGNPLTFNATTTALFIGPDGKPANWQIANVPQSLAQDGTTYPTAYSMSVTDAVYANGGITNQSVSVGATSTRTDSQLSSLHDFSTVPDPNYPSKTNIPYGLQLLSVPYDFSDALGLSDRFGDSFGGTAVSGQQIALFNALNQTYVEQNALTRGLAFWVRFRNVNSLTSYVQDSIGVLGTVVPASQEPQTFAMSLSAGWNMIGDPWNGAAPTSGFTVVDSAGNSHTWADALSTATQLIDPTFYTFDTSSYAYDPVDMTSGSLSPWVGYWVYAYGSCQVQIPATSGS